MRRSSRLAPAALGLVPALLVALLLGPLGCRRPEPPPSAGAPTPQEVATSFFEATWSHDQAKVEALIEPDALTSRKVFGDSGDPACSFLSVNHLAPWNLILWQPATGTATLVGEPVFSNFDYAQSVELTATYTVDRFEPPGPAVVVVDFQDRYLLRQVGGEWRVCDYARSGVPRLAEGGQSGWSPAVTRDAGGCISVGPFTAVNLVQTAWDPSGRRLAFTPENFDRNELWVVDTATAEGKCLLSRPVAEGQPMLAAGAGLVGWTADGNSLLYLVPGTAAGPGGVGTKDRGDWVQVIPVAGGEPTNLAFLPQPGGTGVGAIRLTSDRRAIFMNWGYALYGVDIESGRVDTFVTDFPTCDGLNTVIFSPDGWAAAWWDFPNRDETVVVVADLRTGARKTVHPGSGASWVRFSGWVGDNLALVEEARTEDLNSSEDFRWAGACVALSLYDTKGDLHERFLPPGKTGRSIGGAAISPDGSAVVFSVGPMIEVPKDANFGPGSDRVTRGDELWVWNPGSGGTQKILDLGLAAPCHVTWLAPSLLRLYEYKDGNYDLLADYDVAAGSDGNLTLTPHLWAGGEVPTDIWGQVGTSLLTARRGQGADGRSTRLSLENSQETHVLFEAPIFWTDDEHVGQGYLALSDDSQYSEKKTYLRLVPLPGSP